MRNAFGWLKSAADAVGVAAFTAVFLAINVQVFMRYVVGAPVSWSEEFPTLAFTVAVMWSAALMLKASDHIIFELVTDLLPPGLRRLAVGFAQIAIAALFAAALPAIIDFALYMKVLKSPILRIRYDFVFALFALFVGATAVRSVLSAVQQVRGSPTADPVAPSPL
jgi:TRAP-type C4-dicarboxylate transport system permease small subunit